MVKFSPRRAMFTSSADSICFRFSSRAPHRLAKRWLSTGVKEISTGITRGRASGWAADWARSMDEGVSAQRVGQGGGDGHVDELPHQARRAGEVDHAIVLGAARQ